MDAADFERVIATFNVLDLHLALDQWACCDCLPSASCPHEFQLMSAWAVHKANHNFLDIPVPGETIVYSGKNCPGVYLRYIHKLHLWKIGDDHYQCVGHKLETVPVANIKPIKES